jgi:hypothetical protein
MRQNLTILSVSLVKDFCLEIHFSDGKRKIVDFSKAFASLGGYYARFNTPAAFRKWKLKDGDISWGPDEAVMFKINDVYKGKVPTARDIPLDEMARINNLAKKYNDRRRRAIHATR